MQVKVKENKSLFKRIIDKIKNSSLYYIVNSSDAEVISPEEVDSTEKVSKLATSSNISEAEMWNIERAFNESDTALDSIEAEVSKVPDFKKESNNPFSIEDDEKQNSDRKIDSDEELTSSTLRTSKPQITIQHPVQPARAQKRSTVDRDRSDD